MRRIMWVGVALLIMVAILGYGLYSLKHISEVNKRTREQQAGRQDAIVIVSTEIPTTIWDKIHADNETESADQSGGAANPDAAPAPAEGQEENTEPQPEVQPAEPAAPAEQPAEETIIIKLS